MSPTDMTYRVLGILADGSRETLCNRIPTKARAERLASEIGVVAKFVSIVVEVDSVAAPSPQRPGRVPSTGTPHAQQRWGETGWQG